MSNYVHNYIFCGENAKEKLFTMDCRCDIFGMYDDIIIPLDAGRFLVIVDTKGMEYRTDFIQRFITEFKDTIWYCIEENEIEQGLFQWNGNKVELTVREMFQGMTGKYIQLRYSDAHYRPLIFSYISDKEIVIENVLRNEMRRYSFSDGSKEKMNRFIPQLYAGDDREWRKYGIPFREGIERTVDIYWDGNPCYIETYFPEDEWQHNVPDGERLVNELISFLENVFIQEKIEDRFAVNDSILEAL